MKKEAIIKRLNELSELAEKRQKENDLNYLPNHVSFYFLSEEEREDRHNLLLSLPSKGEEIQEAKKRISERIKRRNKHRN